MTFFILRTGTTFNVLKIAFKGIFKLGSVSHYFYDSNYISCEVFMLVSYFARLLQDFVLTDLTIGVFSSLAMALAL